MIKGKEMNEIDKQEHSQFHWAEGLKFVIEGFKALFLINGAGTISILTFIGDQQEANVWFVIAMISYAFGAFCGVVLYFFAYLAQLGYGNFNNDSARFWHYSSYFLLLLSGFIFVIGTISAAVGFLKPNLFLQFLCSS